MKLSEVQLAILKALAAKGEILTIHELCERTGKKWIDSRTTGMLRRRDCMVHVGSGYMVTDIGRTAAQTGVKP